MKRIKAFLAATGIFLTFITAAQNAADTSFEKTVFWQVTGNGLADTSYLFGTIHPVFREDVHIAANMLQALLRSEMVFFEHQLYNIDDTVYLSLHSMEKPVLKRLLGGLCFRLLKEKLALYNDTITSSPYFLRLRPDYLGGRIINDMFGPAITSMDATLMAIALGNGQPVNFLDSKKMVDELNQLIPLDDQATRLYHFLRNSDLLQTMYTKNIKEFTRLYYSGNFGYIYTRSTYLLINDQFGGMHVAVSNAAEKMLDDRNRKWLPVMLDAMKKQSSFFAVGAAHLAGYAGLITLLRKKGYTLTPLVLEY
jgi:uncharacterized protein